MKGRRGCIVGDSLFAETLTQTLHAAGADTIEVIGSAATLEAALPLAITRGPVRDRVYRHDCKECDAAYQVTELTGRF